MNHRELAEKSAEEITAYMKEIDACETGVDAHFGDEAAGNIIILRLAERLAASAPAIADTAGAKLVPIEPTWEMIAKGSLLALGRNLNEATVKRVWAGMLSVSPAIDAAPVRDVVEAWDAYFPDRTNEQAAVRFVLAMNKLRETLNPAAIDTAPKPMPYHSFEKCAEEVWQELAGTSECPTNGMHGSDVLLCRPCGYERSTASAEAAGSTPLTKAQRTAIEASISISREISNGSHDGSFLSDESVNALKELLAVEASTEPVGEVYMIEPFKRYDKHGVGHEAGGVLSVRLFKELPVGTKLYTAKEQK